MQRASSMRRRLMGWIAAPLLVFVAIQAWDSYQAALATAQTAFDRLLVTSAHALADLIWLERGELQITLPHAALELYAGDVRVSSRDSPTHSPMVYRVSYTNGDFLAGDQAVQPYDGLPPVNEAYAARLKLYDTQLHGEPMRMAALWQPVESAEGLRYVIVQIGEYSAYRFELGRRMLWQTLERQAILLALLLALWLASTAALRPLQLLAQRLEQRKANDLSHLPVHQQPREMAPMLQAFNGLLGRIEHAQVQQQRFVADASHQLRTPLAVLQLHANAGLQGDVPMPEALHNINATTRRTSRVVHQLLMWNRVRQGAGGTPQTLDLRDLMQDVAIQQSPLLAQKHLDFSLEAEPCAWQGEPWMVEELLMNLLSNAIRHTPDSGALGMTLQATEGRIGLTVWDSGPGLSPQMQQDLFTPLRERRQPGRGPGPGDLPGSGGSLWRQPGDHPSHGGRTGRGAERDCLAAAADQPRGINAGMRRPAPAPAPTRCARAARRWDARRGAPGPCVSPGCRPRARHCPWPPTGCAASARGRCGGWRCLRCGVERWPRPN